MSKIWLGGIFIKDEGGYKILLKSLNHYKKRLRVLGNSPELKDTAAMFASVLQQEAMKTISKIDAVTEKIKNCLTKNRPVDSLIEDIPFFQKALTCYDSDIKKAQDTGHEYFVGLVGDITTARKDVSIIREAQNKINEFYAP